MPSTELSWLVRVMQVIYYAGLLSLLLPVWVGYQKRHALLAPHQVIWWCCIMWSVLTLLAESLRLCGYQNIAVWNAVTVLEALFIGRAFYLVLRSARVRRLLRLAGGVFITIAVLDNFYLTNSYYSTLYTTALASVLVISVILLYFEQILHELRDITLEREPMFVIGVGVLIYYAATTVIFLQEFMPLIEAQRIMAINSIFCIGFHVVLAHAFVLVAQTQPNISTTHLHARKRTKL